MKSYQLTIKLILINSIFLFSSLSINACALPFFEISNCLKSQTWATWNSDYQAVKEICAGMPIDISVYCSKGGLPYGDEICVYEIIGGVETLLFCDDASTFSFVPEEGKTYRIETLSGGSQSFTVSFTAVDCLDFDIVQNNDCDVIYENRAVTFSIPGFNSDCYTVDWNFGDGTQLEYYDSYVSHEYNLNLTDPCQTCQTFTVSITLNNEFCGEDCPELSFEKEVTVCRETYFTTGHEEEYVEQCYNDPCIVLGDYSNSPFNITPCYYDGFTFEWTIQDNNWGVQTLDGLQHTLCPAVEGTYTLTMTDPWGCTYTKTMYVYNSLPPDTTIITHTLCALDQEMFVYSPGDCQNIEYDPPYMMLPPYTNPQIIRCYDDNGCLNKVYIHQPVYDIPEACISDIEDICEGDDLIVDGSCSDPHDRHQWEIYEAPGAWADREFLWAQFYTENENNGNSNVAGVINLSQESGLILEPNKCYYAILTVSNECNGEYTWSADIKHFCIKPKPPCFGGPDVTIDPCIDDCVTIGLNGYSDVIPYPYPNLSHVWEDGTVGIYRTVCPTETTTYYLTTTNEFGCVCIDEVTVTVIEHEPLITTDFPVCFSNNNPYGSGQECELEVCIDVQINTGSSCECPYSVTRLCQVIPFGETYCFELENLDLPFDGCASVIGSQYTLGGNIATLYGSDYSEVIGFSGSSCICDMYTLMYFEVLPDGTIVIYPTFTVGMNSEQGELDATSDQNIGMQEQGLIIDLRDEKEKDYDDISIYPNPTHSSLNIEMPEHIELVEIYSIHGELIYNRKYSQQELNSLSIDVSNIHNGTYIIRVQTLNENESRSIIINH